MVGRNVGRDLYSAARPSRRNCLITMVTPAIYPRFLEFLYVDIQSTGHTLSRPWSRQLNDVKSEIECALHSELFKRRHSTRQSHGLFALAKHLFGLEVAKNSRTKQYTEFSICQCWKLMYSRLHVSKVQ